MIAWFRTLLSATNTKPDQEYYSYCKWFFHDDGTASNIHLSKPMDRLKPPCSAHVPTNLDVQETKP